MVRRVCFGFTFLALGACVKRPPVPEIAPSGDGWMVYNQSYNVASASATSSSYTTPSYGGTTTVTVTQTSYSSENTLNIGSYTDSAEKPLCEGYGWVGDCPAFQSKAGGSIRHAPPSMEAP